MQKLKHKDYYFNLKLETKTPRSQTVLSRSGIYTQRFGIWLQLIPEGGAEAYKPPRPSLDGAEQVQRHQLAHRHHQLPGEK